MIICKQYAFSQNFTRPRHKFLKQVTIRFPFNDPTLTWKRFGNQSGAVLEISPGIHRGGESAAHAGQVSDPDPPRPPMLRLLSPVRVKVAVHRMHKKYRALLRVEVTHIVADPEQADDEAEFMFACGVLLQLMNDLHDLRDDLAHGHMTIFTRQASLRPLDGVTARLWAFRRQVLWSSSQFASAQPCSLNSWIQENFRLLLLQTVARNQEFYTPVFVAALEACSPVRFSCLARQEKTLAQAGILRRWPRFDGGGD